jgi:hypothetical protein
LIFLGHPSTKTPCIYAISFMFPFEFIETCGADEEAPTRMDEDMIEN